MRDPKNQRSADQQRALGEEDSPLSRKEAKQQRKISSATDRSKYKKTDLHKFENRIKERRQISPFQETLVRGRVLSIAPQGILVESEGGMYSCSLRGLLKRDISRAKNLVAVGDFVHFQVASPKEGIIAHVEERYSTLSRAEHLSRHKAQLIAANIDQVLITASIALPPLKPGLLDRYIIAARKGSMLPIIVINKIDLLDDTSEEERLLYQEILKVYAGLNIPVISVSTTTGEGLDALKAIMNNKTSVFSGQSGVGKSSLINATTGLSLKTGLLVEKTKKGSHTTTTTQLIPLECGGWCIDTPGIKSFGVWDLKKEEIEGYFTEIHECGLRCKYPNCSHTHEPDCAVQNAAEEGLLSPLRFDSYRYLIEDASEKHRRR